MIVISCYNPEVPRTVTDEELLATMLASLIKYRNICSTLKDLSQEQTEETYHLHQIINCDRLIGLVFPLLGLTFTEVVELMEKGK